MTASWLWQTIRQGPSSLLHLWFRLIPSICLEMRDRQVLSFVEKFSRFFSTELIKKSKVDSPARSDTLSSSKGPKFEFDNACFLSRAYGSMNDTPMKHTKVTVQTPPQLMQANGMCCSGGGATIRILNMTRPMPGREPQDMSWWW